MRSRSCDPSFALCFSCSRWLTGARCVWTFDSFEGSDHGIFGKDPYFSFGTFFDGEGFGTGFGVLGDTSVHYWDEGSMEACLVFLGSGGFPTIFAMHGGPGVNEVEELGPGLQRAIDPSATGTMPGQMW